MKCTLKSPFFIFIFFGINVVFFRKQVKLFKFHFIQDQWFENFSYVWGFSADHICNDRQAQANSLVTSRRNTSRIPGRSNQCIVAQLVQNCIPKQQHSWNLRTCTLHAYSVRVGDEYVYNVQTVSHYSKLVHSHWNQKLHKRRQNVTMLSLPR
jgi:hypothetical protein